MHAQYHVWHFIKFCEKKTKISTDEFMHVCLAHEIKVNDNPLIVVNLMDIKCFQFIFTSNNLYTYITHKTYTYVRVNSLKYCHFVTEGCNSQRETPAQKKSYQENNVGLICL